MKNLYIEQTDADVIASLDTEYERLARHDAELVNPFDHIGNVKRELNRKLMLANKYGYDEYADELANLLERLDMLRKASR